MIDETARWSYLCHLLSLQPHQDNELLVYHMCEMHQRNVTLCMCLEEVMCTYPQHCFYCYQTGHLFGGTHCALCTFEGCWSYRIWLHFLPLFLLLPSGV